MSCVLLDVRCSLSVVCCMLYIVCCLLRVVCCSVIAVCCSPLAVNCSVPLSAVSWYQQTVNRQLQAVRCSLYDVLFAVRCFLAAAW